MRFILNLICISIYFPLLAGNENKIIGARSHALGYISSVHLDLWNAENNPAGLGFHKKIEGGFAYESPFLLNQLAYKSAVFVYPTKMGAFGLSIGQFGYHQYNENNVGLSYGQQLGKNFSIGVQLAYLNTQIAEGRYGNNSTLSGTVSLMSKINEEISFAAVIININRAKRTNNQNETYPTLLKLGLAYDFSTKVRLLSEVVKDIDYNANTKIGIEYLPIETLFLRLGYSTNPAISTFGFGLLFKNFQFDFAAGFHSSLGFTPQVSLSFGSNKSNH